LLADSVPLQPHLWRSDNQPNQKACQIPTTAAFLGHKSIMRASLLSVTLASLGAFAAPAAEKLDTLANVEPNKIDILGGDFGMVNNAITIEIWNQISTALSQFGGNSDPASKANATVAALSLLGPIFEGVAKSFGDELPRWLGEQFQMWLIGTEESDPTEVICSLWQYPSVLLSGVISLTGPPARKGDKCMRSLDGGSGPYKANSTGVSGYRTVYHPVVKPNVTLPVVAWTGCISSGNLFHNLLTEIASHGYLVVTTGPVDGIIGSTLVSDTTRNIDWALSDAAKKYGNADTNGVIIAGHSCGGLEALSASYKDPRVKLTMLFDSGIVDPAKRTKLGELKAPIAYFYGGLGDRAYQDASLSSNALSDLTFRRLKPISIRRQQTFRSSRLPYATSRALGRSSLTTQAGWVKRPLISSTGRSRETSPKLPSSVQMM
jgi:hypothetical protein